MNSQWYKYKILVNYTLKKTGSIIYYIDAYVIEGLIIIQVHSNYPESLLIKMNKNYKWGIYH